MDDSIRIESLNSGRYKAIVGTKEQFFPDIDSAVKWATGELYGQDGDSDG